jgi:hypothetical protein
MKLEATQEIRVFIDKKLYGNTKLEVTDVGKIPEHRRENLSWKGCYYTIMPKEVFYFDRSNNWDSSYFKLENGAEFQVDYGNFMSFINDHSVNMITNNNLNAPKSFLVNGYFKDDKAEFTDYLIRETDEVDMETDEDVFFYGLSEKEIKEAIELGEATVHDFVITSYTLF